jgi:DNA-binding response OmpR family regulator
VQVWIEGAEPVDPWLVSTLLAGGLELAEPDGADVCVRDLRAGRPPSPTSRRCPVLALARPEQVALLRGDHNDDVADFLIEPIDGVELALRLRRLARPRAWPAPFRVAQATIDLERAVVRRADGDRGLTPTEVRLLGHLYASGGRTVSHEELLRAVWAYHPHVQTRTPIVTVQRVRAKIELDPSRPEGLVTVRGTGYRLVVTATPSGVGLIGREEAWAAVRRRLDARRFAVICGPAGVGKTRLARAMLGSKAVEAGLIDALDEEACLRAIGRALSLPGRLAASAIGAALAHRDASLLLDAADACPEAACAIAARVASAHRVDVIVTTRANCQDAVVLGGLEPAAARALLI